ncbi:hypothetical protein CC117_23830 [Parafrankia colletiae]|uniref:N-formylglutamate amidohydrolase n=1 Tax=Parafrankia colletiae TaxID=573497 RepID=A0A1S1QHH4_9ACTN|nr:N-formylglutamate amidohydrolase [Parafrankia colletiae]MCK9902888.1 N-formylglutamate amidohydrolase [Frankia sp. Cpl3]OHV33066.1 hypothetical protein CC117_23830 [Parafrankia colletiae]
MGTTSSWESWIAEEEVFSAQNYEGSSALDSVLVREGRRAHLVLTAPHAVAQIRAGRTKLAERGTGGLAMALAAVSDVRAVCAVGRQSGDPAWDARNGFKNALADLDPTPRYLIDLHGMRDSYGLDIDLGLGGAPDSRMTSLCEGLSEALRAQGLRAGVNSVFKGDRVETLTSWAQRRSMSAIQIEIAARLRPPTGAREPSMQMFRTLRDFLSMEMWLG